MLAALSLGLGSTIIGLVPPVTAAILEWTEAAAQGLVALIEF